MHSTFSKHTHTHTKLKANHKWFHMSRNIHTHTHTHHYSTHTHSPTSSATTNYNRIPLQQFQTATLTTQAFIYTRKPSTEEQQVYVMFANKVWIRRHTSNDYHTMSSYKVTSQTLPGQYRQHHPPKS